MPACAERLCTMSIANVYCKVVCVWVVLGQSMLDPISGDCWRTKVRKSIIWALLVWCCFAHTPRSPKFNVGLLWGERSEAVRRDEISQIQYTRRLVNIEYRGKGDGARCSFERLRFASAAVLSINWFANFCPSTVVNVCGCRLFSSSCLCRCDCHYIRRLVHARAS